MRETVFGRGIGDPLYRVGVKANETPEQCRRRVYQRLFGILWVGILHQYFPAHGFVCARVHEGRISDDRQ